MKRAILSLAMAAALALSGCSGNSLAANSTQPSTSSKSQNALTTSSGDDSSEDYQSENSNYSGYDTSQNKELEKLIENGSVILSPTSGTAYMYDEEEKVYVAVIDFSNHSPTGGYFYSFSPEEVIMNCYLDTILIAANEKALERPAYNIFWVDSESGLKLGSCMVSNLGRTKISEILFRGRWDGYEKLSENEKYLNLTKTFSFAKKTDTVENDGYAVRFTGNNKIVGNEIVVEIEVENTSSIFIPSDSYYLFAFDAISPNGDVIIRYPREDFSASDEFPPLKKGEITKSKIVMPYSGDGNYRIEFYEPLSTEGKYAYFFTIDSSGNNTSGSKQSDVTENHKDNLEYDNFIKSPDVEQFVVDKSRHIWYCSGGAIFASYLEENNFSELTDDEFVVMMYYDMVYGTKEYLSYMPIYTFYISDKNGDYVALGFVTVTSSENGNDVSFALTWFGEYERLNTNAKQIEIFGDGTSR